MVGRGSLSLPSNINSSPTFVRLRPARPPRSNPSVQNFSLRNTQQLARPRCVGSSLGHTPVNVQHLKTLLERYPDIHVYNDYITSNE